MNIVLRCDSEPKDVAKLADLCREAGVTLTVGKGYVRRAGIQVYTTSPKYGVYYVSRSLFMEAAEREDFQTARGRVPMEKRPAVKQLEQAAKKLDTYVERLDALLATLEDLSEDEIETPKQKLTHRIDRLARNIEDLESAIAQPVLRELYGEI